MAATFILSLDCEGKWGVADHLTARHERELSDERLREAYSSIVRLLDEYRIEATFAFVGAFSQSKRDFARIRPGIEDLRAKAPNYLGPALRNLDETSGNGWHGDHLLDLVSSAKTTHEVALHGVTHVPWTSLDGAAADAEMAMLQQLAGPVRASRTFVYPRNQVAHTEILARHSIEGFRTARTSRSRARSLLSEFNIFEMPEFPIEGGEITPIPAGFFLNWRSGPRAFVPAAVTRLRARRLLSAAARCNGVVHYWFHPENIASAPGTLTLLRNLLRDVAEAGDCQVLTQLGYCRRQESLA